MNWRRNVAGGCSCFVVLFLLCASADNFSPRNSYYQKIRSWKPRVVYSRVIKLSNKNQCFKQKQAQSTTMLVRRWTNNVTVNNTFQFNLLINHIYPEKISPPILIFYNFALFLSLLSGHIIINRTCFVKNLKSLYSGHHRDIDIVSVIERRLLHKGFSQINIFSFKNLL